MNEIQKQIDKVRFVWAENAKQYLDAVEELAKESWVDDVTLYASYCDSPIELIFATTLLFQKLHHNRLYDINIRQQVKIGKYRVDFVVTVRGYDKKVVVECDGHDFHERNKYERSKEKARDRFIMGEGYDIMHFTGSDIVNHPFNCVFDVLEFIMPEHKELFDRNRNSRKELNALSK